MSDCRFGVSPVNYPDPDVYSKSEHLSQSATKPAKSQERPVFALGVKKFWVLVYSSSVKQTLSDLSFRGF